MESPQSAPERQDSLPKEKQVMRGQGCALIAIFVVAIGWILLMTAITQSVGWLQEQTVFAGYLVADPRWQVPLFYGAGILLPMGIMAWKSKTPRSRLAFQTWAFAGAFVILQTPARFFAITNAQAITLAQIGLAVVYLMLLHTWLRRFSPDWVAPWKSLDWRGGGLAVLIAAVLSLPWMMWGAFGSLLDILLSMAAGLLFGIAASWTVHGGLLYATQRADREVQGADIFLDGLVIAVALAIMVTGFGYSGMQWVLLFGLPVLGWTTAILATAGKAKARAQNWAPVALLLGLSTAVPLMLVDADELSVIIGSDPGERLDWATRSGEVMLVAGLVVTLVLAFTWRRLQQDSAFGKGSRWIALAAVIAVVCVHVFLGVNGLHGERFFVILKDQADLSMINPDLPWQDRRAEVYGELVEHASLDQQRLRAVLDRLGIQYKPYYLVNALEVQSGPILRAWLNTRPEVDRILDSPILRPLPEPMEPEAGTLATPKGVPWNVSLTQADRVWNDFHVDGNGILVGISDSDVEGWHPEIKESMAGNGLNWLDPWYGSPVPTDISGHGTAVTSVILGKTTGIAPGAEWMGCVNLARNLGNPAYYVECMQFLLAPYPQGGDPFTDGNPALGAQVVNYSWSCPIVEGCDPDALLPAAAALRAAGIFQAAAVGNMGTGYCGTAGDPPAIYSQVFSVGSINSDENMSDFSSVGPVLVDGSLRIKPDLLAPGEAVIAANAVSSYESVSGTSFASPHVAGVVALMWSANPAMIGNVELTEDLLRQSADAYTGPSVDCSNIQNYDSSGIRYGILNAYEAVRLALAAGDNP